MILYLDFAFLLICLAIAAWDFLFYKIPNNLLLAAFGIVLVRMAVNYTGDYHTILYHLATFGSILGFGYILFILKKLGAGDSKYLAVASLFFPLKGILMFLLLTSLAGGFIALLYKYMPGVINALKEALKPVLPQGETLVLEEGKTMPYGIAITLGILGTYILGS